MSIFLIGSKSTKSYCTCHSIINSVVVIAGVEVNTPFGERRVHAMRMVCSLDLLAKAALLNMKQYNGANGCSVCDAPRKTFPGCHLHRFWPFDQEGALRTDTTMRTNALNAAVQGKAVKITHVK